jgi:hypothetical protein
MTSQNPKQADTKPATIRHSDGAQTPGDQPEVKELTDQDIAAVVGGSKVNPTQPVNPADAKGR